MFYRFQSRNPCQVRPDSKTLVIFRCRKIRKVEYKKEGENKGFWFLTKIFILDKSRNPWPNNLVRYRKRVNCCHRDNSHALFYWWRHQISSRLNGTWFNNTSASIMRQSLKIAPGHYRHRLKFPFFLDKPNRDYAARKELFYEIFCNFCEKSTTLCFLNEVVTEIWRDLNTNDAVNTICLP